MLFNGLQTIVQQIHRESLGYSSRRVQDYCPVDSQGIAGLFFSTGSRLLSSRFTGSRWVILPNGFQTIVQQILRESLGYSSQRVLDYCQVDSQGVAGLCFSTGSRLLSSRFTGSRRVILFNGFQTIVQQIHGTRWVILPNGIQTIVQQRFTGSRWVILLNGFKTIVRQIFTGSRWVILLNGFQTIVKQVHRESLGYSARRVQDYCPVDLQGVAGLFFSTGSRQLSSRFTGSRLVILLDGFQTIVKQIHRESLVILLNGFLTIVQQRFTGSHWVILLNGFQTIVQQIFTGSRWVILLNGLQTIVQQISTVSCWVILLNWFQTIVKQIHREPLGYCSKRVQDYCPVDSEGVAWLYSSTGCRLLSSIFTGSRWVILLDGFKTIVQQIHRESRGYSSQRVLDYCPVDSQEVAGLFFPTGSRLLSSRFSGSRWVILLNGFQTIVKQIHRESLGYASQRVQDYCPVDSQGVAGLYFSTGSRLLFSRFMGHAGLFFPTGSRLLSSRDSQGVAGLFFSTGSRLLSSRFTGSPSVILLNGFQTIAKQIHRESLGNSARRVQDYCPVDLQGVAGLFFSTGSRQLSSRFTGSRWVILLNGFQTIVQQIIRESLGYSSQRVLHYCPVDIHRESLVILLNGFLTIVQQRFTGSHWVIVLNGFKTIVQQIQRESLGYALQRVVDYCPVDSQGVAGLFFSTGSRLLSSRFTGNRGVILLNGFQTIVQQIHRKSLGYSSQRVPDNCPVDSQGVAGLFFSTGSRLLSSRFTGSRWVMLLNGFKTIVQQIHRESPGYTFQRVLDYCSVDSWDTLGYSSQRVLDYCPVEIHRESLGYSSQRVQDYSPVDIHRESLGYSSQRVLDYCQVGSQGVAGLFFSTGSRLLSSRFSGSRWVMLFSGLQTIVQNIHGSHWVILHNGFQTIVQLIHRESLGYSTQRVLDYCPVDIHRESLGYSSQRVLDYCPLEIHRESMGYSSQRFLDYCPLEIHRESLGYSSQRFLYYCPVEIHRESLGYSSKRVLDYCPVDIHSELLGYSSQLVLDYCKVHSQGVAGLFF